MLFRDYVKILQSFFKKNIGEAELCNMLFDFVIVPANIEQREGELLFINKSTISRIMRQKGPIPKKIRDHIYDDIVVDGLVNEFKESIVPELNPETEDLCHKMMVCIQKDSISSSHIADFQLVAHPNTIDIFLAKVFTHAITTNDYPDINDSFEMNSFDVNQNPLCLKGLAINGDILDSAVIQSVNDRLGNRRDKSIATLESLYHEIIDIKIHQQGDRNVFSFANALLPAFEMSNHKKETIVQFARLLKIELPDGFFDFGGLKVDKLQVVQSFYSKESSLRGTEEEVRKGLLMLKLYDEILEIDHFIKFYSDFSKVYFLPIALMNKGTNADENIVIQISIPKSALLTENDLSNIDDCFFNYLVDKDIIHDAIDIPKGVNYITYKESKNSRLPLKSVPWSHSTSNSNYLIFLLDYFDYEVFNTEDVSIIRIVIDKINPNSIVAFPQVILLGNVVKELKYVISSKNNSMLIEDALEIVDDK